MSAQCVSMFSVLTADVKTVSVQMSPGETAAASLHSLLEVFLSVPLPSTSAVSQSVGAAEVDVFEEKGVGLDVLRVCSFQAVWKGLFLPQAGFHSFQ